MDWYKSAACAKIDEQKGNLGALSDTIWTNSKKRKEEKETLECITKILKKNDFTVTTDLNGMPMTFKAEYGANASPRNPRANVAFLCRFDTSGKQSHVHGNNLVAEVAVAAALGVKAAIEMSSPVMGKVTVIGCPYLAKGGAATLVNLKVFREVDVVMTAVPGPRTDWCPHFMARKTYLATFTGSAGNPSKGVRPCDEQAACMLAYQNVQEIQNTFGEGWKVTVTLGRTRHPKESRTIVCASAPSNPELFFLDQKITPCLQSAAKATECHLELALAQKTYYSFVNNIQLAYLLQLNAYHVGTLATPRKSKKVMTPVDMGNVSHVVPTLMPMFYYGSDTEIGADGYQDALKSTKAQVYTISMAKALAMTALDVLETPGTLSKIKEELAESLAMEKKDSKFRPFVLPPVCQFKKSMPFDSNTGWSKQV